MEQERINALLKKYKEGKADAAEMKIIESLIEAGIVELSQLEDLHLLQEQLLQVEYPGPSSELDLHFYDMLAKQKNTLHKVSPWKNLFSFSAFNTEWFPKYALAVVTLSIGLVIGILVRPSENNSENVALMNQQLTELREMMLLSLLEKESASERLKAVSLSNEMYEASDAVTDALIQTLQKDPNVNVRLSALEALKPYVYKDSVRIKLVQSISTQESPLVQVALAELMAAIQEQSSVKEFKKLLDSEHTPGEVKQRIEESIKVMI